jgi:hypothetical protein
MKNSSWLPKLSFIVHPVDSDVPPGHLDFLIKASRRSGMKGIPH